MRTSGTIRASCLVSCAIAAQLGGAALAWGPDVAVTTHEGATEATSAPSMCATDAGDLLMVRDNATSDCFDVMRSNDGGLTWSQFFWYCGGSATIRGHQPSIAVADTWLYLPDWVVLNKHFAYVVFTEGPTEIRQLKIDLDEPESWSVQAIASIPAGGSASLAAPRIVTDNDEEKWGRLYVTYTESKVVGGVLTPQVVLRISDDEGVTWGTPHAFGGGAPARRASGDAAYASGRLHVAYSDDSRIYVVSTHAVVSSSWSTPVTLAVTPKGYASGWPGLRIAASGDTVVVTYGTPRVAGLLPGIGYAYSTDGGLTWHRGGRLTTGSGDLPAALTVDPRWSPSPSFHLAFLGNQRCWWGLCRHYSVNYTTAASADPAAWSWPVKINDGWAGTVYSAAVAVDVKRPAPGVPDYRPGVAWQDYNRSSRILYDLR